MSLSSLSFIGLPKEVQHTINTLTRSNNLVVGTVLESGPANKASGNYTVQLQNGEQVEAVYRTTQWSGVGNTESITAHTPVLLVRLDGSSSQYIIVGFVGYQPDEGIVTKDGRLIEPTEEGVLETGVNFSNGFSVLTQAASEGFLGRLSIGPYPGKELGSGSPIMPGVIDYVGPVGDVIKIVPGVYTRITGFESVIQSSELNNLGELILKQSELLRKKLEEESRHSRPTSINIIDIPLLKPSKITSTPFYSSLSQVSEEQAEAAADKAADEYDTALDESTKFQERLDPEIESIASWLSEQSLNSLNSFGKLDRMGKLLGLNLNLAGSILNIGSSIQLNGGVLSLANQVIDFTSGKDMSLLQNFIGLPTSYNSGTLSIGPVSIDINNNTFSFEDSFLSNQISTLLAPLDDYISKLMFVADDISEVAVEETDRLSIAFNLPVGANYSTDGAEPQDPNELAKFDNNF